VPVTIKLTHYPDLDALDERATRRWTEGCAALSTMPAPAGFTPERWRRIVDAAGVFLERWAAEAIRCGWSDLDVFGIDPAAPAAPNSACDEDEAAFDEKLRRIGIPAVMAALRTARGCGMPALN
jgi:hypothetical protein